MAENRGFLLCAKLAILQRIRLSGGDIFLAPSCPKFRRCTAGAIATIAAINRQQQLAVGE